MEVEIDTEQSEELKGRLGELLAGQILQSPNEGLIKDMLA
jgi:hypothetical protein